MTKCVQKIKHSCGSHALQVFEKEGGGYDGFCFACATYVPNPYNDKPPDYSPPVFRKSPEQIQKEIEEVADYPSTDLPTRRLKASTLSYFNVKVGVSEVDGKTPETAYFPYYKDDELIGYKVRLLEPKKMWALGTTKEATFFGWQQAVIAGGKKLFITEGEFDAMALFQIVKQHNAGGAYADLNPAVVSLSNGAGGAVKQLSVMLPEIRKHFKEVVLVFDTDKPGKDAVEKVLRICPDAVVANIPGKDVNECLIEGRVKAVYNAVVFNAAKPKNTRLVYVDTVVEDARKEAEWGFSYPYPALTDLTRGQRLGETVYWGAGVKMGKSELLNDLVAHNILEHGWKVFVIKPEESNKRTLQGVVGKVANRIFHDPKIPFDYEAFDAAVPKVADKLVMLNLYQELSWQTLEADIRSAAADGCKAVYIDPITVLSNGVAAADANVLLQKFAQGLAQMAMDLNIIVHIFCHLKSPDNGPSHERGGAVQSYQFAGSRAMMRACHSMIGMEGNKDPDLAPEERNLRTLVVLEDRATGASGKVRLFYDQHTGAFNQLN
jgi:twinkle protein